MYKYLVLLFFLLPGVYCLVTIIRNYLYDIGFLFSYKFKTPIICIGNLNTGGTGKTPHTEFFIKIFSDKKIVVLSRGYKRKTKGYLLADKKCSVEDLGDEPFQIFQKYKNDIDLVVCENRVEALKKIEKDLKPEIIIMDDGFQHRALKPFFNIILTEYNRIFFKDFILPFGNLRELRSGVKRADIVIVTKTPLISDKNKYHVVSNIKKYNDISVYFSKLKYSERLIGTLDNKYINGLENKRILLITGISNSSYLENYLSEKKILFNHKKYKDHHNFTDNDILEIQNIFLKGKYEIILTTEKDFVRLNGKIDGIYYIEIKVEIEEEEKLKKELYESLRGV